MREIGVRELKTTLSQTLRAVGRGQRVRVTVRGRPVADIVPTGAVTEDGQLQRLVAEGRLVRSTRPHPKRRPPLIKAARSGSSLVLADREAER